MSDKFNQVGTKDGHLLLQCKTCQSPHRAPADKLDTLRCLKCEPITRAERGLP